MHGDNTYHKFTMKAIAGQTNPEPARICKTCQWWAPIDEWEKDIRSEEAKKGECRAQSPGMGYVPRQGMYPSPYWQHPLTNPDHWCRLYELNQDIRYKLYFKENEDRVNVGLGPPDNI